MSAADASKAGRIPAVLCVALSLAAGGAHDLERLAEAVTAQAEGELPLPIANHSGRTVDGRAVGTSYRNRCTPLAPSEDRLTPSAVNRPSCRERLRKPTRHGRGRNPAARASVR
jgi:hypothetical protein